MMTALLCVALAAPALRAQNSSGKRPCTINFVQGNPVKGYFIRADAKTVTIEADGVRKTIKLDNVTSIVFTIPQRLRMKDEPAAAHRTVF